jgi:ectoine hydroxylase-related dioxygenase (phytanoyl-CoA dioxygenase family)
MTLTAAARRRLDEDGYLALEGFCDDALLGALRRRLEELFAEEGERAGCEFKQEAGCRRLANLVDKGEVFERVIALPALLGYVAHVLGPGLKLSSLNARSVPPGFAAPQPLHADMGAVADEKGYWVCNTVWMLDDFTSDNGAIRVVPGSHAWRRLPQEALADPRAPHPREVLVTGRAGTVVVMNAHLWHGGMGNHTAAPRTALHAFYARRDRPQQQYQKRLLRPEVQARLSPALRWLLALDDPLNDAVSAAGSGVSGFLPR